MVRILCTKNSVKVVEGTTAEGGAGFGEETGTGAGGGGGVVLAGEDADGFGEDEGELFEVFESGWVGFTGVGVGV